MGRCYEFGVSIRGGCEHAMVVPAEGGRCECVRCGSPCTGQFKACAAIISTPGYTPATAPAWALVAGPPQLGEARDAAIADVLVDPAPAHPPAVREQSREQSREQRADRELGALTELIEDLSKQLSERDTELGALFDRVLDAFTELQATVDGQREAIDALTRQVTTLQARVEAGGSLFGLRRR